MIHLRIQIVSSRSISPSAFLSSFSAHMSNFANRATTRTMLIREFLTEEVGRF
jgi:hypothetical protein